jgi:hypothetical protein
MPWVRKTPPPGVSTSTPVVPPVAATPTAPTVTTETATTTTTTITPSSAAVPWMASLKFRAYVGGWLTLVIGWLVENLATAQFHAGKWTWIALGTSTLLTVRAVVADWMNPAVVAPFAAMNKDNVKS